MQTLKERYAIKRLNKAQKQIVNEQIRLLREHVSLLERSMLNEGGPSKEALKQALAVLEKLESVASKAKLGPIDDAIKKIREQITAKFEEAGGLKDFIRTIANDVQKNFSKKDMFSHNPIGYGMRFTNSLIDGFTKLNDIVEIQGVKTSGGSEPKQAKQPTQQQEKPTAEAEGDTDKGEIRYDLTQQRMANSQKTPKTPVEQTDKSAGAQTENPAPDEREGSLGAAIIAANPKYKGKLNNIIAGAFDLDDYSSIVPNPQEFVKAIMNLDLAAVQQIHNAISQMQAETEAVEKQLVQQQPQQAQQGAADSQQTPDQQSAEVDINDKNVQDQTRQLAQNVAHQLVNNKMNLKFADTLQDDLVKFFLSKVTNQKKAADTTTTQPAAAKQAAPQKQQQKKR